MHERPLTSGEIELARLNCGDHSDNKRRQQTNSGAQRQHSPIDFPRKVHRHAAARGEEQHERVTAPVRHHQSAGCAKSREDQPFRHQLPHQPAATGADGQPNGHFMASRERPHQQQIADVRARNQQDKHDHDEHDFERGK